MKVLITGGNGFLGQHLSVYLSKNNFDAVAAGRGNSRIPPQFNIPFYSVDFTNGPLVQEMIYALQPNVIVHAAAISKPDECEKNHPACLRQNVEATKFLIESFENIPGIYKHFIFTSTDFIFGEGGPHSEDDLPAPLNFYGESKLMAELVVNTFSQIKTIVRPVFIYGNIWDGLRPSFLHWVKNNLEKQQKIKVVSDQYRTPTYVYDLCAGIEQIIIQKKSGAYHLAGKDFISPYQMAVTTANVLGLDSSLIENVNSDNFPEPVKRAKHSGLKIDKAITEINYNPLDFEQGAKLSFI